jgi:hypothetical protein
MCIEPHPLLENALSPRRDNLEFASKVTDSSDLRKEKHDSQITSTTMEYQSNLDHFRKMSLSQGETIANFLQM